MMTKLQLKEAVAEAKAAIRAFRQAHGIKNVEKIEDETLLEKFNELKTNLDSVQAVLDAFLAENKKGSSKVGGRLYSYGKITDLETGEERDLTKEEEKKWRTHARKAGKKLEPKIDGASVEFDPDFFKPRVKKVKEKKEKEATDAIQPQGEAKEPKKVKKVRQVTQDED